MKILIYIFGTIIISMSSILIYESFFGPEARFNKRLDEYYRFNIQEKCGINDNDYMKKAFMKISRCLDSKDRTIDELNSIIHQN
jgi:hypothetical protein